MSFEGEAVISAGIAIHARKGNNDKGVINALRAAESLKLDKDDMRASGALFILSTPQVWVGLSDVMQLRRSQLLIKWHATPSGTYKARHPMAGLKPDEFRDRVQGMASWLASVDGQASASVWQLPTAIQLVGCGFVFPEHLDGLLDSDVHRFSVDEKERCLLRAALPAAREKARTQRKRVADQMGHERPTHLSANYVADTAKGRRDALQAATTAQIMVAKGPTAAMKVWANQDVSQSLKALDARASAAEIVVSARKWGFGGIRAQSMA